MLQLPKVHVKTMEAVKTIKDKDTTFTNNIISVEEDVMHKTTVIGTKAVVFESTVILHITFGHRECVPTREKLQYPRRRTPEGRGVVQ